MKRDQGLTLIELIVTVAILSVLFVIGAPKLASINSSNRMVSAINNLSGDIAFARSEAINRNTAVRIQAISSDWSNGWTIEVVSNLGTSIRVGNPMPQNFVLSEAAGVTSFDFNGDGRKSTTGTLVFTLCKSGQSGNYGKQITLNASGRFYLETGATC